MSKTEHLHKAKRVKNDEFFTRITDIEKELSHYQDQLKGLWVYSPCDDYRWSNFPKYFTEHYQELGLSTTTMMTKVILSGWANVSGTQR